MIAGERQRIRVELGDERSYDVVIGRGVVDELLTIDARTFIVLYDTAVEALAQNVLTALGSRVLLARGLIGGEDVKTWELAGEMFDWFADAHADRDTVVIAIGGGTVTDLAGFIAATYLRGLRWCAVPTTLLAAVDAAVGGKTAINLGAGKNLVGAFHHPSLVAIDTDAFTTLDPRDIAAGVAEALKTGLVADAELFAYLERELPRALAGDPDVLAVTVAHCVAAKARVVAGDERETDDSGAGGRAILNFGHTVGHALEKTCGYGALRHGEAIALGMRAALALSRERGLDPALADRIEALVRAIPAP
ncbi:MAG TPA: 3-dehydroquinate synthase family protein, partial [Candidatus Lustribacter sp.]|nr:3-dehydroquinate synthase family protein [Candidatus Lustribacter sp.]